MRQLVAGGVAVLVTSSLLAGCTSGAQPSDDMQVAPTLAAAEPAVSPPAAKPAGTVLPLRGKATASAVDAASRTFAVAVANPPSVRLYDIDDLRAAPKTIKLPGAVDHLSVASGGGTLLAPVPSAGAVVTIALPGGARREIPMQGRPTSAVSFGDRLLVALPDRRAVAVVRNGRTIDTITGDLSPEQVLVAGGHAVVLDRLRSAVFDIEVADGSFGAGLRAEQGAVNAVVDRFGRVLVTEARIGQLFAFTAAPMLMRQRFPVPGVPYGIAYDARQDLAWVSVTRRNEVVGYDVAGGEPVQRKRFATVRQPDSVAVDPRTGRVLVASADGEGIQVIQP
ncbi:MAG: hypothetical protein ACRDQ5_20045 [Sciscionella sp.]